LCDLLANSRGSGRNNYDWIGVANYLRKDIGRVTVDNNQHGIRGVYVGRAVPDRRARRDTASDKNTPRVGVLPKRPDLIALRRVVARCGIGGRRGVVGTGSND
jgi:hypothetical protein